LFNGGNRELKKKIEEIDFIKGIAIIGVVMVHITAYYLGLPEVDKKTYLFLQQIARYCVPMFSFFLDFFCFTNMAMKIAFLSKGFIKAIHLYSLSFCFLVDILHLLQLDRGAWKHLIIIEA
jgi:surface polysaccharide O-acyltransferase-like enzyme